MNKNINIAIVGLGQIGNYLYNELNSKKKRQKQKQEKKQKQLLYQQKIKIKKDGLRSIKKFFTQIR